MKGEKAAPGRIKGQLRSVTLKCFTSTWIRMSAKVRELFRYYQYQTRNCSKEVPTLVVGFFSFSEIEEKRLLLDICRK
jgi:hypothetical protein